MSDIDEEEDEELGDFEDWLGSGEEAGGDREAGDSEGESSSNEEGGSEEDDEKEIKRPAAGAKRKRGKALQPTRKTKPRMEIEYEHESNAPVREAVLA